MSLFDSASLCVTPNAYKEDKLYSIKPTDGSGDLVVTRATTATRVNSAGLVELVPRNLIQQSETFDTTWTKYNSATITNNAIVAPNGTTTADLLISGSAQEIYSANMPKASEELFFTFSCYAKIYNTNVFQMVCSDFATSGTFANFNLSTLTVNVTTGATWSNSSGSITNVGNGWYRCVFTSKSPNTSGLYLSLTTTGTNSVSGVYIWGAQVEQGSTATEYFPTTDRLNVPRIDYTNGSCPSILVEPQRTNLALYSEQFDNNIYWSKTRATITANATTSPDGTNTADLLTDTTFTNDINYTEQATSVSGNLVTMSIFVKKGNSPYVQFGFYDNAFHGFVVNTTTWASSHTFGSATNFIATNYGNGWYRLTMTKQAATNFIYSSVSVNPNSNGSNYNGTSSLNAYFWGFQIEIGSYATSYIPTVASAVTRNADVISKTGISSLIGQTEGTFYGEFYHESKNNNVDYVVNSINNGDYGNSIFISIYNNEISSNIFNAYSLESKIILTGLTTGKHKVAIAYKLNDIAFYVDGVLVGTDSTASIPTLNNINISYVGSTIPVEQRYINALVLWKTRLTNTELATLTTI
jgi:hypothetical protein